MTSSRGSARFIGPKATSSKTLSATCESWVAGFWKPMPMRWLSRCIGQSSTASPSSRIAAADPATDRARRQAADDEAERRLAGLRATGDAQDLAVTEVEVDVEQRGLRLAGIPIADARQLDAHGSQPARRATMSPTSATTSAHLATACAPRVRGPPQQRPAPRPSEATSLERHRALLDLGDRAEDHRSDDRQDAPDPAPDGALGVEASGALRRGDLARALDHGRHGLDRGIGHERHPRADAAPLEVDHEVRWPRRQVEQRHRAADRQDPRQDLEGEREALGGGGDRTDLEQDRRAAGEEEQVDRGAPTIAIGSASSTRQPRQLTDDAGRPAPAG